MRAVLLAMFICSILAFSIASSVPTASARHFAYSKQPDTPSNCKSVGGLPDSKCTPGAVDTMVTQQNIKDTICKSGYTKTVRPPVSYTEPLKIRLMKSYGIKGSLKDYELDHLVPLEVGGNPTDVKNLWPEPWHGNNTAAEKDKFENYLHIQVCSGNMKLQVAQMEIASNWFHYWSQAGRP